MGSDFLIIAIMVVTIIATAGLTVNGIISKATAYYLEKDARARGSDAGNSNSRQLAERTEMIEERLAVLERLATDRGTLLSDEIEALRLDVSARREKENG
ncbi:hypothetical protein EH31_13305 [Erythrobacter longus]|uniref:Uncharacterized protein n=1 Tax=Erythrobacter longus TaxID=1044 RepID=A0A074MAZ8_ERYLO|nr:hypothetical protein [Erythrobacter longus]KEO89018.1 hypothetical protein EH31_13305 [Erythrobacter longus]